MFLETRCANCRSDISFNTWEETRADYAKNKGKVKALNCKKCGTVSQYHINDFTARHKTYRVLAHVVLYGLYTPLVAMLFLGWITTNFDAYYLINGLFTYYSVIAAIPFALYMILKNSAIRKERAYNTYRVKQ